jgi:serine/threonine-protein kinase
MSSSQTLDVPGYQVMTYLGSGARSTIWQIRNCRSDEMFALKRVVKRHASDARFLEQAENEYAVGSQLDHPSIRHIYDIRRIKRWLSLREIHLVMEMCPGLTVQEHRPTAIPLVMRIFTKVAAALNYMNTQGFVHADMKPNNIIITNDGQVKIIDLGQSCRIGTVKQRIQGTPDFIAPEQVHRRPLDSRTDVFNFGASLYWTLTGQAIPTLLPKKGNLTMMSDMALMPVEHFNSEVPPSLSKLVADCIQAQPVHRPKSMKDVLARMELIRATIKRAARQAEPENDTEA